MRSQGGRGRVGGARVFAALACLALATGCTALTGVDATPVPCTLARAGADTTSAVITGATGDTTRVLVSVGWCRP